MTLSLLALACLVGAALAGPFQREVESHCSTECPTTSNSKFNYQPGSKYVYTYKASNLITVAGNRKHQRAELTGTAEIYVKDRCEMTLRLRDVRIFKEGQESSEDQELIHQLEANPLSFSWVDGKIEHVCASQAESVVSENIKKSILSAIINTMSEWHSSRHSELDSFGACDTKYSVIRQVSDSVIIRKEKSLKACDNSQSGLSALVSQHYSSPDSDLKTVPLFTEDKRVCEQEIQEGIIQKVICTEHAVVKPLSKYESIVDFQGEIQLTLRKMEKSSMVRQVTPVDKKSIRYSYDQEQTDETKEKEAIEILTELCSLTKGILQPKVSKLYYDLIIVLKGLPEESVQKIYDSLKRKEICESEKTLDLFLDALPMAGTEGTIKLMVNLLLTKQVTGLKAKLWPASFALIPNPNAEAISAVLPLVSEDYDRRPVLLGLSAMIHRVCSHSNCDSVPAVQEAIKILHEGLGSHCSTEDEDKIVSILKAFGNMGYMGEAEETVLECATSRDKHIAVRLAAIDAFRRYKTKTPSKLVELYESSTENFETRIAAISTIIKNADTEVKEAIERVLKNDKDEQVVAYTASLVNNWKKTSSPLKQDVRDVLQEIDADRDDISYWPNSKNIELSTFNVPMNLGASVESNIIHETGSKIPRSVSSRFDVDLFGRNVNLFEFGARAEGLDKAVKKLIGIDTNRQSLRKSWFPLTTRQGPEEEKPQVSFFLRTMETEILDLSVSDITSVGSMMQVADTFNKLAQGQKSDFSHSILFLNTKLIVQSVTGRSYTFGMTGSATAALTADGKFDVINLLSSPSNCHIEGRLQPSANLEFTTTVGIHSQKSRPDIKVVTSFHTGADVGAKLRVKDSHLAEARLDMPSEEVQLLKLSTELYEVDEHNNEKRIIDDMEKKIDRCIRALEKPLGVEICAKLEVPKPFVSRNYPYAHGIGNAEISIRKTDLSMSGYAVSVEIPKRRSNSMLYRATFDTPGSSIKRKFEAVLDVKRLSQEEKQFKLDMQSPFKDIALSGSYSLNKHLLQSSINVISDKTKSYSMKTVMEISSSGTKKTYKPTLQWKMPGKEAVSVTGSVSYDEGRKQHLMVDIRSSKPEDKPFIFTGNLMKEGRFGISKSSQWKMSADLVAKSPYITAKLHSMQSKRSGQSDSIASLFSMDYTLPRQEKQTVKFSSDFQKSSSKIGATAQFENTQLPHLNLELNWNMQGMLKSSLKQDAILKYGRNPESNYIQISQVYNHGNRDTLSRGSISVKAPQFDIDTELQAAVDLHMKESSNFHVETDLRYKEDKHVKTLMQMKRVSQRPLKMVVKGVFEYPKRKMIYQDEIVEISPNVYEGQSQLQWKENQKAALKYTYRRMSDRSTLHHEIDSSFYAPFMRRPITHRGMVKMSRDSLEIQSIAEKYDSSSKRRSTYSVEAMLRKSGPSIMQVKMPSIEGKAELNNDRQKKSASLDVQLKKRNSRRVTAIAAISWEDKKAVQAQVAWDADRNPDRKVAFEAQFDIDKRRSGNSYNAESRLQCLDICDIKVSSMGQNGLKGPHEHTLTLSGRKFEPIEIAVEHEMSRETAHGLIKYKKRHQEKAVAELSAKMAKKSSGKDIEVSATLKSPDNSFEKKELAFRHTHSYSSGSMSFHCESRMELASDKVHEAKVDYVQNARQSRELKIAVKTPYRRFEEQEISLSHDSSSDSNTINAAIVRNGKEISMSTELKNNRNLISLTSTMKTPYSAARDMKFQAALEKKRYYKQAESQFELNGETKYHVSAAYKSKQGLRELHSSLKASSVPEIAIAIKSEAYNPSFNHELSITKNSARLFSCKVTKQSTGDDWKSQLEVKTSRNTLIDVKATKEARSNAYKKYTVKAKGLFKPVSLSMQSTENEENSVTRNFQVCREMPERRCYNIKGYYKKEANSERYNKYRKITFDIEEEKSGSVRHLCNIHYLLSVQGHTIKSKVLFDSPERKLGYDFSMKIRQTEEEPCEADLSIILPTRTMRTTVSALHGSLHSNYDVDFCPDISDASQKLSLQLRREYVPRNNRLSGHLKLAHPALEKPFMVQYNIEKGVSGWPVSSKLEIDYSINPQDKITAEMTIDPAKRRQNQQTLSARVYSPGCDLDLTFKVSKQEGKSAIYVCSWKSPKEGELKLKLYNYNSYGVPKSADLSYSSSSSEMTFTAQCQESEVSLKLMSEKNVLGEVLYAHRKPCVELEIKAPESFLKKELCVGQNEDERYQLFSYKAYCYSRKCAHVKLELDPSKKQIAHLDIQWDKRELQHVMTDLKNFKPTVHVKALKEISQEYHRKVESLCSSLERKLVKPLTSAALIEARKVRHEIVDTVKSLDILPELPKIPSSDELKEMTRERVTKLYEEWNERIERYLKEEAPEWLRELVEKLKAEIDRLLKEYCSRTSLCYKVKRTYERHGMKEAQRVIKVALKDKLKQIQEDSREQYNQVTEWWNSVTEMIYGWADEVADIIKMNFPSVRDWAVFRRFSDYYCRTKNYIHDKFRKYFEDIMDYVNRLLDHAVQNDITQVLSENIVELKTKAMKSWRQLDANRDIWQPLKQTILEKYPRSWIRQRITVRDFNIREGRVNVQLNYPFVQPKVQLLKKTIVSAKNKYINWQ